MTEPRFMECDACREKPGSPTLCAGCLHNREVIYKLSAGKSVELYHDFSHEVYCSFCGIHKHAVQDGFVTKHCLREPFSNVIKK